MATPFNSYLQVRLSARQREALEWWARESEVPLSELVREFLSVPHPDTFGKGRQVLVDADGEPSGYIAHWDVEDVQEKLQDIASGSTDPGGER